MGWSGALRRLSGNRLSVVHRPRVEAGSVFSLILTSNAEMKYTDRDLLETKDLQSAMAVKRLKKESVCPSRIRNRDEGWKLEANRGNYNDTTSIHVLRLGVAVARFLPAILRDHISHM